MKKSQRSSSDFTGVVAVGVILSSFLAIGLLLPSRLGPVWSTMNPFADSDGPAQKQSGTPGDGAMGPVLSLPKVVVNLHAGDADAFVDAAFDLEVATEKDRDAIQEKLPRIQEASINLLSSLRPEDLKGSEGLDRMKGRLLERFRDLAPRQRLKAVYVSHLVVD
ncbi:MAG TPA: flagellar basal body-associated FliL family protein [Polyangia bacterium]